VAKINPRYLAYCRAHGNAYKEQLAKDTETFPGGKMTGFVLWLQQKWREFRDEKHPDIHMDFVKLKHGEFDKWLRDKFPIIVEPKP
jgi:hypothetical protein